jgi:hypothetical protein
MTDLEALRADLSTARVPRKVRTVAVLAAAVAATITAAAVAASHYLGQPAPAHVKASFARFGGWQTPRSVDPSTARVVAFSDQTVLYGADARDGGTCLELVGKGGFEYQFLCDQSRAAKGLLLFGGIPEHGTASALPPVTVSGRVATDTAKLEARSTSGSVQKVPLGLEGFFTFEPSDQSAARRGELTLSARDVRGAVVGRVRIPAPIVLDTTGVPPRTVRGVDENPRARYAFFEIWAYGPLAQGAHCRGACGGVGYAQTGTTGTVKIRQNGSFTFVVPHVTFRRWYLTMVVADARLIPLDPDTVDATPVPDATFWAHAKAEAARA